MASHLTLDDLTCPHRMITLKFVIHLRINMHSSLFIHYSYLKLYFNPRLLARAMMHFLDDDMVNLEILGGDFLPESIKRRLGSQISEIQEITWNNE